MRAVPSTVSKGAVQKLWKILFLQLLVSVYPAYCIAMKMNWIPCFFQNISSTNFQPNKLLAVPLKTVVNKKNWLSSADLQNILYAPLQNVIPYKFCML